MTTQQATERGIPRWLVLALPDDVEAIWRMVEWLYSTPATRAAALAFELRKLRREVWDRQPRRPIKTPSCLRPSKLAKVTGYRTDAARHSAARKKAYDKTRSSTANRGI